MDTLKVKNVFNGDRCIKFHLVSKLDGFEWAMIPVYGAAQDEQKHEFLAELVRECDQESLPLLLGGDFNIMRRKEDKSNNDFSTRWPFLFNAIIDSLDLKEIELTGRQYTWANHR